MEVLKLNAAYMPLELVSFKSAFKLIEKGSAEIVDVYDDRFFRTWKQAFNAPCVIRLVKFVAPKKKMKFYKAFTRKNVYKRDKGICQYCGKKISLAKMTYDHVVPKSRGGRLTWTNIVCCCLKCNTRKYNHTLAECGMKLLNKPYAPVVADNFNSGMINRLKGIPKVFNNEKWKQWIYFNVELDQD